MRRTPVWRGRRRQRGRDCARVLALDRGAHLVFVDVAREVSTLLGHQHREHLREAIEADLVIATGVTAADTPVAATHPLATSVHRKTITNLITWPLTAQLPQYMHAFTTAARRPGPSADGPVLRPDDRMRFLDHRVVTAQRGTQPAHALLRRQAAHLLGFDGRTHVVEWLRREEQRRPPHNRPR